MPASRAKKTAVAAVAALSVAVGGTALAASGSGGNGSSSFFDAVAKHLGITSDKLKEATKAAATDQVDAEVAAGTLTQAQADAIKKQIAAGAAYGMPAFGHRHGFDGQGGFVGGPLADASAYLGLDMATLMSKLQAGSTLADVAKAQGKTVDGLKAALVASEKKELDAAVTAGRLTRTQADAMLAQAGTRFDDVIAGKLPARGPGFRGDGFGFGGDHDGPGFGPSPGQDSTPGQPQGQPQGGASLAPSQPGSAA